MGCFLAVGFILASAAVLLHGLHLLTMTTSRPGRLAVAHGKLNTPHALHGTVATTVVPLPLGSFYTTTSPQFPVRFGFSEPIQPATLISLETTPAASHILSTFERFRSTDDVFDDNFLNLVILASRDRSLCKVDESTMVSLRSVGVREVAFLTPAAIDVALPVDGPYFVSPLGLSRVWKLFPDTYGAFVASTIQVNDHHLTAVNASIPDSPSRVAIAVPSRLYYPPRADKPLNGLRVGIKDNIDVAGITTYASSRAFGELYGKASESAPAVRTLLDLGAVIVGKTVMSQFADAEDQTADFVEFHAPWNPRGDGNRSPGGSSFGSGAAAGAYDWIDFTVGTDTGGSVRQPAAHQSVFGFRPSRGKASVEGTVVIHRDLDAIGVLSKDLAVLQLVSGNLFPPPPIRPVPHAASLSDLTLIYPSHLFPCESDHAQELYDKVITSLEDTLGVKRTVINFYDQWKRTQPHTDQPFDVYFESILHDYVVWGQYTGRASFREEYQEKFGRKPYVNPLTQLRWKLGADMTAEHFQHVQRLRAEFQSFIETIFGGSSLMLTPFLFGEPDARDIYRPNPSSRDKAELAWGLRPAFQSPFAGQPEIVFPVGQMSVSSDISGREEEYGVIASIIVPKVNNHTVRPLSPS